MSELAFKTFVGKSTRGWSFTSAEPYVDYPGLAGFLLDFDGGDHHISDIGAGFFKEPVGMGLFTSFADQNSDDHYNWKVDRLALPAGTTLDEVAGHSESGFNRVILKILDLRRVPILVGFSLRTMSGGDHHMNKIRVELFRDQFNQLELGIIFEDKHGPYNISFHYRVAYALVPANRVVSSCRQELAGSCSSGLIRKPIVAKQPVLQGFELDFKNADHHLDQIGVRLAPGGHAMIYYNDKNDDDDFNWKVWWVDVKLPPNPVKSATP